MIEKKSKRNREEMEKKCSWRGDWRKDDWQMR